MAQCDHIDRNIAICVDGNPVSSTNPLPISGGGGGGGGGAVTIADGADITQGAKADAAASSDTGTFSVVSFWKRLQQKFTTQFPSALTGSGNFKVSLTESTASQAITAASLPLPTGAATEATVLASSTAFGAQADAAASSDTGTFSFIALFKRQLQKWTTQLPAALTGSGNLKVAIQEPLPAGTNLIGTVSPALVAGTYVDAGTLSVTTGGTSQQLFAANASRCIVKIQNLSTGDLYFNWNAAATIDNNSLKILPNAMYETPFPIVDQRVINIIGATTGQKFAAKEI